MSKPTFQRIELLVVIVLALLYGSATYQRNSVWKDDLSLWTDIVKKTPRQARAYHYLGLAYHNSNDLDSAIIHYKKSLSLNPFQSDVHNNIGISYFYRGDVDTAIIHFKHALSINPNHADAHYNLGIAYGEKGLLDLAHEEIRKGKRLP
jgi:tetratricopeptide (TPR) repeat protein